MMNTVPTVAPKRRTPTWVWLALTFVMLSVLLVSAALGWLAELDLPAHVVIDGTEYWFFDPASLSAGERIAVACAVVIALVAAIVVVPVALLIGLAGLVVGLVFGLGVPLLIAALVVALVCSPLLLVLALAWWVWRKSQVPRPASAANIAR
jgi:hypothetical protein